MERGSWGRPDGESIPRGGGEEAAGPRACADAEGALASFQGRGGGGGAEREASIRSSKHALSLFCCKVWFLVNELMFCFYHICFIM